MVDLSPQHPHWRLAEEISVTIKSAPASTHPQRRNAGVLSVICLALACLALTGCGRARSSSSTAGNPRSEPTLLELGKPIERDMRGGEEHTYRIHATAGQFIHVVALQKGIDVLVILLDPAGKQLVQTDSLNGSYGPEPVSAVAGTSGDFELRIATFSSDAPPGQYQVQLTDLREPTAADRARINAERTYAEGHLLYSRGDVESERAAAEKWQESVPMWRALDDKYGEALALYSVGAAYDSGHEPQKALEPYTQALSVFRAAGNRSGEAAILSSLATDYDSVNEREHALDCYAQSLSIARDSGDRFREARTLLSMGEDHDFLGEKQKALDSYAESLPIWRAIGDRSELATTLVDSGKVYSDVGEKQKALDSYAEALPLEHDAGDQWNEAITLHNMGSVYDDLGEKKKALEYYSRVLPLRRAVGDRAGEALTLGNMGSVYGDLGEEQTAVNDYGLALSMERDLRDPVDEAATLNNIAIVYVTLGEMQKALGYYNQALPLLRASSDRAAEAVTLGNVGLVYSDLGEKQKALGYYNQALPLERALMDRDSEAYTLSNIGTAYSGLGENEKALGYYNQALPLMRAAGDRRGEAAALNDIGSVYSDLGEKQKARDDYLQALPLFQSLQDPLDEGVALVSLMRYESTSNNAPAAIFFGKEAIDQFQQVRRNIHGMAKEDQASFLKSKADYYRDLAGLLISAGRLPEAQQVLDMLKLEEFAEYTQHRDQSGSPAQPVGYSDTEQAAKKKGDQIGAEIAALGQEWGTLDAERSTLTADEKKRYDDLSTMRQYLAGLSSDFAKLTTLNDITAANERLRNYKDDTSDLQHLLAKTDPGTVAIYTVVLPDRLSLIVITPNTMFAHDVAISAKDLRNKVSALTQLFAGGAAPSEEDVRGKSQALYGALFEPEVQKALDGVGAKTLLWSLDDVLRYVPMAALYDGKQYLVERYQNVELTADRGRLLEEPHMAAATGLAMGISKVYDPADRLGPLDSVPGELDAVVHSNAVSASHGPIAGSIMLNDAFTEKSLVDALGTQPQVVHIASHYVYKAGSDENSFLLLGGKDTGGQGFHLTLAELEDNAQIKFDGVELLTLSGCQTAVGANDADGHEVDALGIVATQEKNAKAVMATLWKVDDASSGLLMANFYKLWIGTAGMTKAEALRQSQLSMLRGGTPAGTPNQAAPTSYANPYYWAPFILIGNWK